MTSFKPLEFHPGKSQVSLNPAQSKTTETGVKPAPSQAGFKRPQSKLPRSRTVQQPTQHRVCDSREIITICLGHGGCSLGSKFNEVICDEHGIDPTGTFMGQSDVQLQKMDVFFNEAYGGKFVPRTVLIDLSGPDLDYIHGSIYGRTFRPDNFVFAGSGASNNFAKGYYTEGSDLIEPAMDVIRREVEMCGCFQGFQIMHSMGGGTGSGLTSLLTNRLKQEYSDRITFSWSIMPSPKISQVVVEPYNCILANHYMVESTDYTICVDNEALYNICERQLHFPQPQYGDLNHIIAMAMTGITASFRFPGGTHHSLRHFATTLVPLPRLHFLIPAYAPLTARSVQPYRALNAPELIPEAFSTNSMLTPCDVKGGSYIATAMLLRGCISPAEVINYLNLAHSKRSSQYNQWLPNDIQIGFCDVPPRGLPLSATVLANSTSIVCMWRRVLTGFDNLFRRKAFLHWYTAEGMDVEEFKLAMANTENLISEYQMQEKG